MLLSPSSSSNGPCHSGCAANRSARVRPLRASPASEPSADDGQSESPPLPDPGPLTPRNALETRKIELKTVSFQCVSPAITRRMHEIRRCIHGLIRYLVLFSSIASLIGR